MLAEFTGRVRSGAALSTDDVERVVAELVREEVPAEAKADFLTALAVRGERVEEIAAFVRALRGRAVPVPLDPATRAGEILDVVGTGGDRLGTFNISTASAILVASAGVRVAKHGNRAITSKAGSADVLEALGIPVETDPATAAAALRDRGFAFFFAPRYHPAFRHVGPARKLCAERGQRTLFNFLGPLLNPVGPSCQLMGVARPALCEPLAHVLQSVGVRRAMVVCGQVAAASDGSEALYMDELSPLGQTTLAEFYQDHGFHVSSLDPAAFPLQPVQLADLAGGDARANAESVTRVLGGRDRGPRRDAVLLNGGAALFVSGRTRSIADGWELAASLIDDGSASAKLAELRA